MNQLPNASTILALWRQELLGETLWYRRLAGDTFIFYFKGLPDDSFGINVRFDPPWRFRDPNGLLLGSGQIPEDSNLNRTVIQELLQKSNVISTKLLIDIIIDSHLDIQLIFEDGYIFESFCCDPSSTFSWQFRNKTARIKVIGSPQGLDVDCF